MRSIVPSLISWSVLACAVRNVEGFVTPSTNLQTEIRISRSNLIKPNTVSRRRSDQILLQSLPEDKDPLLMNGEAAIVDYTKMKPQVYGQRWVQLAYLSMLALLSDWVCFSVAAAPDAFEQSFGHSAASIIDIFLFTNVATSFLVTDVVTNFGMQKAIQAASVLMALGCWLRAGVGFMPGHDGLVGYNLLVVGTVLVGIAQPFFQCTPPMLSATWFANNERSTSTAIALNFNQIGIATAFLVGGSMATTAKGLENYLGLIAFVTTLVMVGTLIQFENEPPTPPSASELEKKIKGEVEPPFLESVQKFFNTRGFTNALAAFICSISITNVVGVSFQTVIDIPMLLTKSRL